MDWGSLVGQVIGSAVEVYTTKEASEAQADAYSDQRKIAEANAAIAAANAASGSIRMDYVAYGFLALAAVVVAVGGTMK